MAQILTNSKNVRKQDKETIINSRITDWDSFLYSYWLQKIALISGFYDDAKKTKTFMTKVRKKK